MGDCEALLSMLQGCHFLVFCFPTGYTPTQYLNNNTLFYGHRTCSVKCTGKILNQLLLSDLLTLVCRQLLRDNKLIPIVGILIWAKDLRNIL